MSWPPTYQGQQSPFAPMPGYGTTQTVQQTGSHGGVQSPETGAMGASAAPEQAAGAPALQAGGVQGSQQAMAGTPEFDVPRADIYELQQAYRVEIEMPGFEEANISVYADENRLIVSGERSVEEYHDERIVQRERPLRLERTLQLPVTVDVEETTATYETGVCAIEVPKGAGDERKRIGFK